MATFYPKMERAFLYKERSPTLWERFLMKVCPCYEPETGEIIAHIDLLKQLEDGEDTIKLNFHEDGFVTVAGFGKYEEKKSPAHWFDGVKRSV